ncbi:WD repeat-containing protein 46 isoform X2 [Bufo bufo]|uniref:WD repeat-containing protein 46 isoform X2 n=1 Tax=Bufo bufo TaxID=8384 RepID=UPI001ABE16E3|nr:WD repeat-containing protein 46 isoform X2 [Bufo bufo]
MATTKPPKRKAPRYYEGVDEKKPAQDEQKKKKKMMGVVVKPKANQARGKKKPQKKGVTTGGDKKRMGVVIKPKANRTQGMKKPQKKGVTTGRNHKEGDKKRMGVAVKWRTNQAQWKKKPQKKDVVTGKMQRNYKEGDKKRMGVVVKRRTNQEEWKEKNNQKKDVISGATDPFPGLPSMPEDQLTKYERARKAEQVMDTFPNVKERLKREESKVQSAVSQAARHDLLLPEEEGFLEGDEGEDTSTITQQDIAEVVDITSASKHFNLTLNQFGPYRINYSRNGRHLLLAGQRGHVASMDWHTKKLNCEMNVMETVNDVRWLHTHAMFAVAQKKWLYIYDNLGVELHCIKKFNDVLRMEFLPYHFLLATCSAAGFLQYLDVSVGREVAATCVKAGRLSVMCQNPHNAVVHLGHHNGSVSLWSPSMKEPLVKMLCHGGAVRALSIDKTGMYMASSGTDRKLTIFDLRTYRPLTSCLLPLGAGSLCHSQRGLLAAGVGNVVQVYKDTHLTAPRSPYMCFSVKAPIHGLQFCPYEDVLGIGHGGGFTSMIVPGAGEANFDGLECNPYETKKQRQEWEVKALLEKIQPELITLDPTQLGEVDAITMDKKRQEQVERMGFDPYEKTRFVPRHKLKGRSSTGNLLKRKKKVAHEEKRAEIRKSLQERDKAKRSDTTKVQPGQRSALDRFKK